MNFYGATITTKRHASQSQGTQNKNIYFYIKMHNNEYDINITYVISLIRYRIQLKVEDSLGMAIFILFDLGAKKLLHI